jgi:hypothetical protein
MTPERGWRRVGYLADLGAHKTEFLKGLTYLVAGFALVLIGTIVGYADSRWLDVLAGVFATTGIVVAFLGFFVHVLPPLLPAK